MKLHFGTDGIRGIANLELTPELVLKLGTLLPHLFKKSHAKILIGKDPRVSSDMLESALVAGLLSSGASVYQAGCIPTPAISILTQRESMDAGIMISASHNPPEHNGIKIFGHDGCKLSDEQEEWLEARLYREESFGPRLTGNALGKIFDFSDATSKYQHWLKSIFPRTLSTFKIVLDCAYGATSTVAPSLFESLGATVTAKNAVPDGEKINVNCGATDLEFLKKMVSGTKADVGIAFDGDGDRVMFVTQTGEVFNGDNILATLAFHWKAKGKLREPIVTTVMANFGLEEALQSKKIQMVRTPVGDRFVLEEMKKQKANLGGEQSGHVILLDHGVTGDGILTALAVLDTVLESKKPLDKLRQSVKISPQILVSIPVKDKSKFSDDVEIKQIIVNEENKLKGRGRILVRPSGTEPLVRVMAEGPDFSELEQAVKRISEKIQTRLA